MKAWKRRCICLKFLPTIWSKGNPAACALFSEWPQTDVLQRIAYQAKQVVTAFVVPAAQPQQYQIRWFSCQQEINLCGHGTLAAAALLRQLKGLGHYQFFSDCGDLEVTASAEALVMRLPQWRSVSVNTPYAFTTCQPVECFQTRDLVLVLPDEQAVRQFQPDMQQIRQLPQHALIVTAFRAPDSYVLRYFAPAIGIDEDIATGSAQCSLAPYWAAKTALAELKVQQLSAIPAGFSVFIRSQQLYLKTQAVPCPDLTKSTMT